MAGNSHYHCCAGCCFVHKFSQKRIHCCCTAVRMQNGFSNSSVFCSRPGLEAGDEILFVNGKPASALQMDDMRAAFADQVLTFIVSAVPRLDPRMLTSLPPRRSDGEHDQATDVFSQSQGRATFRCCEKNQCDM